MSSLSIKGRLYSAGPTEQKSDTFSVRHFTLEITENNNGMVYTNYAGFQLSQSSCTLIDQFQPGQLITVHFNIRGNLWNGKTITNLQAWKLELVQEQQQAYPQQQQFGQPTASQYAQPQYQQPQAQPFAPPLQPQQFPAQPQQPFGQPAQPAYQPAPQGFQQPQATPTPNQGWQPAPQPFGAQNNNAFNPPAASDSLPF